MSREQSRYRRSNAVLFSVALWIGLLAGCSGGGEPAFSSGTTPAGGSAAQGSFPQANDTVFALAADGNGGVYVGGQFTGIGDIPRRTLAHILANGAVDPTWEPAADGPVTALAVENQTLYIGGSFLNLNGVERWRLAAVDRVTGDLAPWNPKLGTANLVNTLVSSGAVVYAGGVFELVNAIVTPGKISCHG